MNKPKVGLFPGTFDPFTIGHHSIVERALNIVDKIEIAIGENNSKNTHFSTKQRLEMITTLFRHDNRVHVSAYSSLTAVYAHAIGAQFIIRGVRSTTDFEYEKTIAEMNRKLANIETIILFTEPHLAHINSGVVRELLRFGHDVSEFVPQGMKILS